MATPVLVQRRNTAFSYGSPDYNYTVIPFPDGPTQAGNAVVIFASRRTTETITSIQDDSAREYVSSLVRTVDDASNGLSVDSFALLNVPAGIKYLKFTYSNVVRYTQYCISEWTNVTAVDGSNGATGTSTTIASGSVTPTQTGDLVLEYVARDATQATASWTKGSQANITWNLLHADRLDGFALQYGVYNSTSALNPTMTTGSSGGRIGVGLFLKTGTQGGDTVTGRPRVRCLTDQHMKASADGGPSAAFVVQTPQVSGNLWVASFTSGGNSITSITGTGMTWTDTGGNPSNDSFCQQLYAGNVTPNPDQTVTVTKNAYTTDDNIIFYEIEGADSNPFDKIAQATGNQATFANFSTVSIAPSAANGIVIGQVGIALCSISGCTSPTGNVFDSMYNDQNTGTINEQMNDNGWAHVHPTGTSSLTFTWVPYRPSGTNVPGNWASLAVSYYGAGQAPTVTQYAARFRNDDGSEATATWAASENANLSSTSTGNVRLRIGLDASSGDPASASYQLEHNIGGGAFAAVPGLPATNAIAYGAVGTRVSNAGATSAAPALPSGVATGMLLIAICMTKNNETHSCSTTGWTKIDQQNSGASFTVSIWKRIADGAQTAPTITWTSSVANGAIVARYAPGTGQAIDTTNPIGATSTNNGTTSTHSCTGFNTTKYGSLVIYVEGAAANTALGTPTGGWAENNDTGSATGATHQTFGGQGFPALGTATGNVSATGAAAAWVMWMLELCIVQPDIILGASANIAASAATSTTAQLTAPSGKTTSNFGAGKISDDTNPITAIDLASGGYTELEWSIIRGPASATNDVYQFRVTAGGLPLSSYAVTPQWTVATGAASFTGTSAVASQKATLASSGTFTAPPNETGTAAVASRKATASIAATYTAPPNETGTSAVASRKATVTASGTWTPTNETGTSDVASRKATISASGTWTPTNETGTSTVTARKATVSASGSWGPHNETGSAAVSSRKATVDATGTWTPVDRIGTAAVSSRKATSAASGNYVSPAKTGTAAAASRKATVAASGTWTPTNETGSSALTARKATVAALGGFTTGIGGGCVVQGKRATASATGAYVPPAKTGTVAASSRPGTATGAGAYVPGEKTGSAELSGRTASVSASGFAVAPSSVIGTADLIARKSVAGISALYTPLPIAGTVAVSSRRPAFFSAGSAQPADWTSFVPESRKFRIARDRAFRLLRDREWRITQ